VTLGGSGKEKSTCVFPLITNLSSENAAMIDWLSIDFVFFKNDFKGIIWLQV